MSTFQSLQREIFLEELELPKSLEPHVTKKLKDQINLFSKNLSMYYYFYYKTYPPFQHPCYGWEWDWTVVSRLYKINFFIKYNKEPTQNQLTKARKRLPPREITPLIDMVNSKIIPRWREIEINFKPDNGVKPVTEEDTVKYGVYILPMIKFKKLSKLYKGSNFNHDLYAMLTYYNTYSPVFVPKEYKESDSCYDAYKIDKYITEKKINLSLVIEMYSSPFNSHFNTYHSLFDKDKVFSAKPNIADLELFQNNKIYYANPPFIQSEFQQLLEKIYISLRSDVLFTMFAVLPLWVSGLSEYDKTKKTLIVLKKLAKLEYEVKKIPNLYSSVQGKDRPLNSSNLLLYFAPTR